MDLLLNRRQMMSKKIIYSLKDGVCDGTADTCINTGIKILSEQFIAEHPKFQIEISFTPDVDNEQKAHVIRCTQIVTPYRGFYIRQSEASNNGNTYRIFFRKSVGEDFIKDIECSFPQRFIIKFDFDKHTLTILKDGTVYKTTKLGTDDTFNNLLFLIGGSVINGVDETNGGKETGKGTIHSLIIRDIT